MEGKKKTREQLVQEMEAMQRRVTELKKLKSERKKMEEELRKTNDELEVQAWGVRKTDEAIKTLYKELEKKNKRLQELNELKSDFVSTVSHELRTPLSIIKSGVEIVLDGITGTISEKQKKVLTTVRDSIDRLARIINSLLDISKIEAGKVELKKELVEVRDLMSHVASSFETRAKVQGLELRVSFPKKPIDVYVDRDKIIQVFTNLAGNALKFTKEGCIEMSTKEKANEIECFVADTGVGIPQEQIDKVFDKFHQVDRTEGPGAKGAGLGLAITKALIGMHNGRIWVESQLGKGSKFTFTLPKTNIETIFREYVSNGLAQANQQEIPMSLIVTALANFQQMKRKHKTEEIVKILNQIREIITETILSPADTINMYHRGEIVTIVLKAGQKDVLAIEKKLRKVIKRHKFSLNRKAVNLGICFGTATYPEECRAEDELIKKVGTSLEERKKYQSRIMVIDDEVELAKGLKIILEANKYQVIPCHSGQEALEKLNEGLLPDLIVLDLLMPVMDGYELYMLFKENENTKDIPIVVLTAKGERADKRLGIEFGPHNYITKPFEPKELLARIEMTLED